MLVVYSNNIRSYQVYIATMQRSLTTLLILVTAVTCTPVCDDVGVTRDFTICMAHEGEKFGDILTSNECFANFTCQKLTSGILAGPENEFNVVLRGDPLWDRIMRLPQLKNFLHEFAQFKRPDYTCLIKEFKQLGLTIGEKCMGVVDQDEIFDFIEQFVENATNVEHARQVFDEYRSLAFGFIRQVKSKMDEVWDCENREEVVLCFRERVRMIKHLQCETIGECRKQVHPTCDNHFEKLENAFLQCRDQLEMYEHDSYLELFKHLKVCNLNGRKIVHTFKKAYKTIKREVKHFCDTDQKDESVMCLYQNSEFAAEVKKNLNILLKNTGQDRPLKELGINVC